MTTFKALLCAFVIAARGHSTLQSAGNYNLDAHAIHKDNENVLSTSTLSLSFSTDKSLRSFLSYHKATKQFRMHINSLIMILCLIGLEMEYQF